MTTNVQWIAARNADRRAATPSGSFGDTIASIAIVVGVVALGAYALDLHGHRCESCGHRWRHLGAFNLGDERSHTCRSCGQVQWWKCGVPQVLRDAHSRHYPASPNTLATPSQDTAATPAQKLREPFRRSLLSGMVKPQDMHR